MARYVQLDLSERLVAGPLSLCTSFRRFPLSSSLPLLYFEIGPVTRKTRIQWWKSPAIGEREGVMDEACESSTAWGRRARAGERRMRSLSSSGRASRTACWVERRSCEGDMCVRRQPGRQVRLGGVTGEVTSGRARERTGVRKRERERERRLKRARARRESLGWWCEDEAGQEKEREGEEGREEEKKEMKED